MNDRNKETRDYNKTKIDNGTDQNINNINNSKNRTEKINKNRDQQMVNANLNISQMELVINDNAETTSESNKQRNN